MSEENTNTTDDVTQSETVWAQQEESAESLAPVTRTRRRRNFDTMNIVLLGMFAAAIGGIYLLGSGPLHAEASPEQQAVEQRVELALAKLNATPKTGLGGASEQYLIQRTINYSVADRQIPLDVLRGNPFDYHANLVGDKGSQIGARQLAAGSGDSDADYALSATRQLAVQSILAGSNDGIALVNDQVVRVGDKINGWTVREIAPRSVTLQYKHMTHTLEMPEHNGFGGD